MTQTARKFLFKESSLIQAKAESDAAYSDLNETIEQLVKADPQNPDAWSRKADLGWILYNRGEFERAARVTGKALYELQKIDENSTLSLVTMSNYGVILSRIAGSLTVNPIYEFGTPRSTSKPGRSYAFEAYNRLAEQLDPHDPKIIRARINLARVHVYNGDRSGAIREFEELASESAQVLGEADLETIAVYAFLVDLYQSEGRDLEADRWLERLTDLTTATSRPIDESRE